MISLFFHIRFRSPARRDQLHRLPDHRHEQAGGEGRHPRHRQQGDRPGENDRDAGQQFNLKYLD